MLLRKLERGEEAQKEAWFCHEKRSVRVGKRISEKYICQYGYEELLSGESRGQKTKDAKSFLAEILA